MASKDPAGTDLNKEFSIIINKIKPLLLSCSDIKEKQRYANWLKKIYESVGRCSSQLKIRNQYAELMLNSLITKMCEPPFNENPKPGSLHFLSANLISKIGEKSSKLAKLKKLPEWLLEELDTQKSKNFNINTVNKAEESLNNQQDKFDITIPYLQNHCLPTSELVFKDWCKVFNKNNDEKNLVKAQIMYSRLQEQSLKLQQMHDSKLQEVYTRKNLELIELENKYKKRCSEQEIVIKEFEKKVILLEKNDAKFQQTKDFMKLQNDNKLILEELQNLKIKYENEKFAIQKDTTKSMEDLMEETDKGFISMETEYKSQIEFMTTTICELENRIQNILSDCKLIKEEKQNAVQVNSANEVMIKKLKYELETILNKYHKQRNVLKNMDTRNENIINSIKHQHSLHIKQLEDELSIMKQNLNIIQQDKIYIEDHLKKNLQRKDTELQDVSMQNENLQKEILKCKKQLEITIEEHKKNMDSLQLILKNKPKEYEDQEIFINKLQKTIEYKEKDLNKAREEAGLFSYIIFVFIHK